MAQLDDIASRRKVDKRMDSKQAQKSLRRKFRVREEKRRSEKIRAEPSWQMSDETLHAGVARSTFPSRKTKNTSRSDHFFKLSCRKSARRCGATHISKSKCKKDTNIGPLLEVEMWKKCTLLWRETHFQVKKLKTHHSRTTF